MSEQQTDLSPDEKSKLAIFAEHLRSVSESEKLKHANEMQEVRQQHAIERGDLERKLAEKNELVSNLIGDSFNESGVINYDRLVKSVGEKQAQTIYMNLRKSPEGRRKLGLAP
jgi:hypothetical protein